jgi:steroid 5-alpha reductase family enzyme
VAGHLVLLLVLGWIAAAGLQLALWRVSKQTLNAGIVDVGWACSFTLIAAVCIVVGRAPAESWAPIAAIVVAWSLRLAWHLTGRGAATGPEDGRYVELRKRWGANPHRAFLWFFQAQALMAGVLAIGFAIPFAALPFHTAPRVFGVVVAIIGLVGETIADVQLGSFRANPANRGRVCDVGMWGASRHPNYFFEVLVWMGLALYSSAYPWGGIAFLAPALVLFSILRVTGIPATEAQAVRTRGDAYRAYQMRVSALVPWFPRKPAP